MRNSTVVLRQYYPSFYSSPLSSDTVTKKKYLRLLAFDTPMSPIAKVVSWIISRFSVRVSVARGPASEKRVLPNKNLEKKMRGANGVRKE